MLKWNKTTSVSNQDAFTNLLQKLFNGNVINGIFHPELKICEVTPAYKLSDQILKSNSIPAISNIYERSIFEQVIAYSESFLFQYLSACRKGYYIQQALVRFLEKFKSVLDNKNSEEQYWWTSLRFLIVRPSSYSALWARQIKSLHEKFYKYQFRFHFEFNSIRRLFAVWNELAIRSASNNFVRPSERIKGELCSSVSENALWAQRIEFDIDVIFSNHIKHSGNHYLFDN